MIDAVDDPEPTDDLRCRTRPRRPRRLLLRARDDPQHLKSPLVHVATREPQLVERDAELGGPAVRLHRDVAGPHGVPRIVRLEVVEHELVALNARGVELEHVARAAIVIAVDADRNDVGESVDITPRQRCADLLGLGVIAPDADVDRVVVVEDGESRVLRRLVAVLGEALREAKRQALRDSLPMALCVVAFGDADWRL